MLPLMVLFRQPVCCRLMHQPVRVSGLPVQPDGLPLAQFPLPPNMAWGVFRATPCPAVQPLYHPILQSPVQR